MANNRKKIFLIRLLAVCAVSMILASCATGNYLRTEESSSIEMKQTYRLILYGGRFSDDRETLAILDKEGDKYEFIVYAPDYDYRIKKKVPAKEALAIAENFVRFHHSFYRSLLSRILDHSGATIGYEVKPLYFPVDVGFSDVIDVHYSIEGKTVIVKIRLRPEAEDRLFERDTPFIFRRR
jgi:hypothetical protein